MIRITSYCSKCLVATRVDPGGGSVTCSRCGNVTEVKLTAAAQEQGRIDQCALCGCGYLYIEKDFPAALGLSIMVLGVGAFLWLSVEDILLALGVLLGLAALDAVLYRLVPFRVICYRCLAVYRGAVRNPEHKPYELGTAGRFTDDYEERRRAGGG